MKSVYVLTAARNRRELTGRFVRALTRQTLRDFHLVLVDDGSSDGTADLVRALLPEATILAGNGNLWWAGGIQACFDWLDEQRVSDEAALLLTNDDTDFDDDFLERGKRLLAAHPETLVASCTYSTETGKLVSAGVRMDWSSFSQLAEPPGGEPEFVATRGLFVRNSDRKKLGRFASRLLPHYYSDYRFTGLARGLGLRLLAAPELRVRVAEGATGVQASSSRNPWKLLRSLFSRRSLRNPVTETGFVLACAPPGSRLKGVAAVWTHFLATLVERLLWPRLGRRLRPKPR